MRQVRVQNERKREEKAKNKVDKKTGEITANTEPKIHRVIFPHHLR